MNRTIYISSKYKSIMTFSLLALLICFTLSCRDENFPTPEAATVTTTSITEIKGSSAVGGGTIVSEGGNSISTRGICWSTNENPTIGDDKYEDETGLTSFSCEIDGLVGGTTYYVRAFATNNGGIAYGNSEKFTTLQVPVLTTDTPTSVSGTSAVCSGTITESYSLTITERGFCYGLESNPTIDNTKVVANTTSASFSSTITDLTSGTIYYIRAYAISSEGEVGYGNNVSFNTQITDIDGNVYTSVKIGNQTWMVENYRAVHFIDGTEITVQYHSNDTNKEYGPSYSWNDVTKANFAPNGWHVPTDAEWRVLYEEVATLGVKLKEAGTTHWNTDNGTNETGFTALGAAHVYGASLKDETTWWTSTENSTSEGVRWALFDNGTIGRYANDKSMLFTVRLIKDE